jgi:Carboxypeptidase regulatory-like domain
MIKNFLMKVKLMAMTTGATLVLIVGAITTMYSQQAFAQANPTSLSLGAFPNKGKVGSAGTLRVSLSGKLTSEGSEVGGATIHITGTGEGKQFTLTTNEFGSYSTFADLAPGTHEIQAYFPGDATHTSSSATRVVTVTS